jgi:hypothetical protein
MIAITQRLPLPVAQGYVTHTQFPRQFLSRLVACHKETNRLFLELSGVSLSVIAHRLLSNCFDDVSTESGQPQLLFWLRLCRSAIFAFSAVQFGIGANGVTRPGRRALSPNKNIQRPTLNVQMGRAVKIAAYANWRQLAGIRVKVVCSGFLSV